NCRPLPNEGSWVLETQLGASQAGAGVEHQPLRPDDANPPQPDVYSLATRREVSPHPCHVGLRIILPESPASPFRGGQRWPASLPPTDDWSSFLGHNLSIIVNPVVNPWVLGTRRLNGGCYPMADGLLSRMLQKICMLFLRKL